MIILVILSFSYTIIDDYVVVLSYENNLHIYCKQANNHIMIIYANNNNI